ncbi:accessory Sec system S-layer assembly protein [Anoxybacillus sp. ST4]|uniref:accessory Sec system S-layer assembly protein n=1 Tax=Anoxybacillus sp. ST4 TaxID=2864181 RepID=UPI001C63E49A|nr:accessory Sec system S-layer assembly protein [Anoxybacillus sp. ST4]MBW7652305.1 accessory Sec system S-layer assembly protein [Anoxybacillus sp. ST4]
MLPFFKKKKQGEDSTIQANQLFDGTHEQQDEDVHTTLSIHPLMSLTTEQKYYFQYMNNELPPLKKNQVSLSGIEWKKEGENYVITAFVRNSLDKAIRFDETPLLFIGPDGQVLGRKIFPMQELGDIPPRSSRPWRFVFTKKDLHNEHIPETGWKLAFELKKTHRLDLEESWKKQLSKEDQDKLEQLVRSLTPPKEGELNVMGLQAQVNEEGNLIVTLLIRNGTNKHITFEQLPLIVEDAKGDVLARGAFTLQLEVKANTSKPWTFIFPKSLVQKETFDFSTWRAYIPQ